MIKTLLDLLAIGIIFTVITGITDFPESSKKGLSWLLTKGKIVKSEYRFHLLDCETCQIFWASMIYLLCTGHFTLLWIAAALINSTFCDFYKDTILCMKDIGISFVRLIYKHLID